MKIVVCDTGPILHLKEIGLLDLLGETGKVIIPKGVDIDLSEINLSWKDQKPSWISVKELSPQESFSISALYNSGLLDMGEAEAIILAQLLKADWFLTDDISARVFANVIGLEVHGSLGVLLWSAATGYLQYNEAKVAVEKLGQSSLWISQTILDKAQKALDDMFKI